MDIETKGRLKLKEFSFCGRLVSSGKGFNIHYQQLLQFYPLKKKMIFAKAIIIKYCANDNKWPMMTILPEVFIYWRIRECWCINELVLKGFPQMLWIENWFFRGRCSLSVAHQAPRVAYLVSHIARLSNGNQWLERLHAVTISQVNT